MHILHRAAWLHRVSSLLAIVMVVVASAGCETLIAPLEWGAVDQAPVEPEQAELPSFIRIAACSATEDYVRSLAEAHRQSHPQVIFDITVAGPEVAASMVAKGEAQLAIVTRRHGEAFRDEDREEEGFQPLEVTPVAESGLAVIVHASQEMSSLTQAELVSLFTGYALDWSGLGAGAGVPEIVVQDHSSTSRRIFDDALLGGRPVSSAAVVVPNDRAAAQYVAEHPGAVSYAAAAVLDERLRAVPVEMGLTSRIGSGRALYPASEEIVVVSPLTTTLEIQDLTAYAVGPQGAELLDRFFSR